MRVNHGKFGCQDQMYCSKHHLEGQVVLLDNYCFFAKIVFPEINF